MADDDEIIDFKKALNRKNLEEKAIELQKESDPSKRLNYVAQALEFKDKDLLASDHRKYDLDFSNPESESYKKHYQLCTKLHKEHDKNGKIEHGDLEKWVRDMADDLMPALKAGVEGEREQNYNQLKDYCSRFDKYTGNEDGTTFDAVKKSISGGEGLNASRLIIKAIIEVRKQSEYSKLISMVTDDPSEGQQYTFDMASHIAKDVSKWAEAQGKPKKISEKLIASNIGSMIDPYITGNFGKIYEFSAYKPDEDKKAA